LPGGRGATFLPAHWRKIHGASLAFAIAAAALVSCWPQPVSLFLFCALSLTPMVFNALFHLAASVFYHGYSFGVISALLLFPSLCWYLVSLGADACLLDARTSLAAAVLGAAVHAMDLASTTFFVQRRQIS
jgi:hypothetical protein